MQNQAHSRPTRLAGLFLAGPAFLAWLLLEGWLRSLGLKAGIGGFIRQAFTVEPVRNFGIAYLLKVLLPIYLVAGILLFMLTLLAGHLARPGWHRAWRGREAFGFGLSAILWTHVLLWWQVPSTLWVLPGLRSLPLWLSLALLGTLPLVYPLLWLRSQARTGPLRGAATLTAWVLGWSLMVVAPQRMTPLRPAPRPGDMPCKVLMAGIDGLRSDTFLAKAGNMQGLRYENAYTVIPATRLMWHILWGGDPLTFTIGHVGASREELQDPHSLQLLRRAREQGWKARFYIDDGGTISLAGRATDLDDALAPAAGWENFVNSNLAVGFPLYAIWENWFKPFPTTNPWAPLDAGLKEALRLGRGSGWVMFHTCLAHQPIFLHRNELAQLGPRWWTLRPLGLEPKATIAQVTDRDLLALDPRTNPFRAYEVRMNSILRSWEPIWNSLGQDPAYRGAARFLFSDHGERFHHISDDFQLQGVHGYNLDPWECKAAFLAAGPGFSEAVDNRPRKATVSLLSLVRGMDGLLDGRPLDAAALESAVPTAPMRYHTVTTEAFGKEPYAFRSESEKSMVGRSLIGPNGMWFMEYARSAAERAKDASVAWAEGPRLHSMHPLVGGGAREMIFEGYQLLEDRAVTEEEFQKAKARIESLLPVLPPPSK